VLDGPAVGVRVGVQDGPAVGVLVGEGLPTPRALATSSRPPVTTRPDSEQAIAPGVTLLGRVTWDWRDATGAPLVPGAYRLVGSMSGTPPVEGNVLLIELSLP